MSLSKKQQFVKVIVPLPVNKLFTYSVNKTDIDKIKPGSRVIVQFGKKKFYTAIVHGIIQKKPEQKNIKNIHTLLDEEPIFTQKHLEFWNWISEYYICPIGEVLKTALPSILRIESETKIKIHPSFDPNKLINLGYHEQIIAKSLINRKILSINQIQSICGLKNVQHIINNLIEQEIAITYEEFENTLPKKTEKYICLNRQYLENDLLLGKLIDDLFRKAPKQCDAVLHYLHLSKENNNDLIQKKLILQKFSSNVLTSLIKKKILEEIYKDKTYELSQTVQTSWLEKKQTELTEFQQKTFESLKAGFKENFIQLLWGVPSSGKTEIYFKLIEEEIKIGKQVLYLLPEIALATHILERVISHFENKALIYHHRFSSYEKLQSWSHIYGQTTDKKSIVVGTRSALFLPFNNLGLIIIDEEQDPAFKQSDLNPHYHARDAAIMLAKIMNAKVLIGTATPSIETYYNAITGKYGLVRLDQRYGNTQEPLVRIVDLTKEKTKNRTWYISSSLDQLIKETIKQNHQVILFQNRRGFATVIQCKQCGWVPMCRNCDVTLTYHKKQNQIRCHLCGYYQIPPTQCKDCGSTKIHYLGIGTEKITEELSMVYPELKVTRLDADVAKKKNAYIQVLRDFEQQQTQILVGTQMISKGLDFENVQLVGIINAENLLHFPDFRSFERAFHLLIQIIGRAGRHQKQGTVIVQTRKKDHPVIQAILNNNIETFYKSQLNERKQYNYPPFFRLINISIHHRNENKTIEKATQLKKELSVLKNTIILGPEEPYYGKIKNYYIRNILLKIPRISEHRKIRNELHEILQKFTDNIESSFRIIIDVDPI